MSLSPAERQMRASLAAHVSWANTEDPTARTEQARRAFARHAPALVLGGEQLALCLQRCHAGLIDQALSRQHHQQAGPGIGLHFNEASQEAIPASFGGMEGLQ